MKEVILVKLGEVVLKGLNRHTFEDILLKNIRRRIGRLGGFDVRELQSTVYVTPRDGADLDDAEDCISKVFGIAAYSRACEISKDISAVCDRCGKIPEKRPFLCKDFQSGVQARRQKISA